jgi:hypothetical protein
MARSLVKAYAKHVRPHFIEPELRLIKPGFEQVLDIDDAFEPTFRDDRQVTDAPFHHDIKRMLDGVAPPAHNHVGAHYVAHRHSRGPIAIHDNGAIDVDNRYDADRGLVLIAHDSEFLTHLRNPTRRCLNNVIGSHDHDVPAFGFQYFANPHGALPPISGTE